MIFFTKNAYRILKFCCTAKAQCRIAKLQQFNIINKVVSKRLYSSEEEEVINEDEIQKALASAEFDKLARDIYRMSDLHGYDVFVVQPYVKTYKSRIGKERTELLLQETIALVETLPQWKVVDKMTLGTTEESTKLLFGKGNFQKLKDTIIQSQENKPITAVVFSVKMLTGLQVASLEKELKLPIYDRFTVVLKIFYNHASSAEAKLQTAAAELVYLRSRIRWIQGPGKERPDAGSHKIGGSGESVMEMRKNILTERSTKLNEMLAKVKKHREIMRINRQKKNLPIVAVVGYTNAGKTSLIKVLTKNADIQPKDHLFATLDVSPHHGILPFNTKCIFIDTVGFISDIPTELIASFGATLEDANKADLLIHVWDISHPDREHQRTKVMETLNSLKIPQDRLDNMIHVANKVDLVQENSLPEEGDIKMISCVERTGLSDLLKEIESRLMNVTGRCIKTYRIPQCGPQLGWLYSQAGVLQAPADENDTDYLLVQVTIDPASASKFRHKFGDLEVSFV